MNKTFDPKDLIERIVNALNASSHRIETNTLNSIKKRRKFSLKKMKKRTKPTIAIIALLTIVPATSYAAGHKRPQHGPPPEAYTVCEGKIAGDAAQFESPHGETIMGTCEQEGDRLVLRPTRSKRNSD